MSTTSRIVHIVGGATMVVAGLAGLTVTASASAAMADSRGSHDAMHSMMDDCAEMRDMMGSGKGGDR